MVTDCVIVPPVTMSIFKQCDCFSMNMKFWKFLGIYSPVEQKFYNWYSRVFVTLFIFLYDGLNTINFYFLPRDLDHFIEEMIFYFTVLAVMSKVVTFLLMQGKITEMLQILDSEMFRPATEKGLRIIDNAKKFNVKYWKIVAIVSYFSNLVHVLSPFMTHLFLSVPLVLPVSSYSFLTENIKDKFIYPLYFYQSIGIHINMLYNLNIDTFFLGLMIFVIAQLEILEEKLMTVTDGPKSARCGNVRGSSLRLSNEMLYIKELNKNIIHYGEVAKFCDLIENVFSVTLFVQFSMASCIICVCLFRFTLPAPIQYYMFLASYIFVMMIQIMVPCWFGTRIMTKSCLLSEAIYACDWTPRPRRFKSTMRLFTERANRPLSITGWKMFPLSLNTFTSIMNSAYSFFTLLRHMQTRGN